MGIKVLWSLLVLNVPRQSGRDMTLSIPLMGFSSGKILACFVPRSAWSFSPVWTVAQLVVLGALFFVYRRQNQKFAKRSFGEPGQIDEHEGSPNVAGTCSFRYSY